MLSSARRHEIAMKAIRTIRRKYGKNAISNMAKKAWKTRRRNSK